MRSMSMPSRSHHTASLLKPKSACRLAKGTPLSVRMSNPKVKGVQVEMGTGNVYADLGFADADGMLIKAQLVSKIAEIIKRKGLTQTQAAQLLGMPQPKLSNLLSGRFRGVSERRLMDCLVKLGRDVQIVVKATPRSRKEGRLSIVFA